MPATLQTIVAATRQRVETAKRIADARGMQHRAEGHTPRGVRRSVELKARCGVAVFAVL